MDDALRLADALIGRNGVESVEMVAAATLRRQHAEIADLRAEVERLRAVAEQQPVTDDALRLADGNAEMEDMLRIQHAIILELRAEVERLAQDYVRACKLVAGMHAAATVRPGEGTRLGVVEDVAAVREEVERLRAERARTADTKTCWCESCDIATSRLGLRSRMSLCPECGDKRCPRAKHHDYQCTALVRRCPVCGMGAGGVAKGYVCQRGDCPTRVTCGG